MLRYVALLLLSTIVKSVSSEDDGDGFVCPLPPHLGGNFTPPPSTTVLPPVSTPSPTPPSKPADKVEETGPKTTSTDNSNTNNTATPKDTIEEVTENKSSSKSTTKTVEPSKTEEMIIEEISPPKKNIIAENRSKRAARRAKNTKDLPNNSEIVTESDSVPNLEEINPKSTERKKMKGYNPTLG